MKDIYNENKEFQFHTTSNNGSVRVGNEHFCYYIDNELGNGIATVDVFDGDNQMLEDILVYKGMVDGEKYYIYTSDDEEGKPFKEMKGKYKVYANDGVVAFFPVK